MCCGSKKAQTIISVIPIYTKLCCRKRGLNDKLRHTLYKCWTILDVTFLEKNLHGNIGK